MKHFLYSELSLGVIRLFPLPTGADPTVSKAEHAELSKNVQEMKKSLSSLEENSVSGIALKELVGTLAIQLTFVFIVWLTSYLPILPRPGRTPCMHAIISSVLISESGNGGIGTIFCTFHVGGLLSTSTCTVTSVSQASQKFCNHCNNM